MPEGKKRKDSKMRVVKNSKGKRGLGEETGIERMKAKKSKKGSRNLDGRSFFSRPAESDEMPMFLCSDLYGDPYEPGTWPHLGLVLMSIFCFTSE